jgi:hypothetical protein
MCILFRGKVFTEPLPSNEKAIQTQQGDLISLVLFFKIEKVD